MADTMKVLNTIGQSILADKEENYPSSDFEFDGVSYLLGKESGRRVQGMSYNTGQGSVKMPDDLEALGIDSGSCVQRQVLINQLHKVHLEVHEKCNPTHRVFSLE